MHIARATSLLAVALACAELVPSTAGAAGTVKVGLNFPKTGPYFQQGVDQMRGAELAAEELNAAGGILGRQIEVVMRDSKSDPGVSRTNVTELIDKEGVTMLFGGSSTAVALAVSQVAQEKGVPFFATLTYGQATTGAGGTRHTFRECYDSHFGAAITCAYLNKHFKGKKYFYITSDYSWGWTTEEIFRKRTGTEDKGVHGGVRTPFPINDNATIKQALKAAQEAKPDVLVVVLFGTEMINAVNIASAWGIKKSMQIVVPAITDDMAQGAGAGNMQGVLAPMPWTWKVPDKYGYERGQKFVQAFSKRFARYPTTSAGSAYTILYEYKAAVERAGTFASPAVIKALEGHTYQLLKDEQTWRKFDHQSVQTVFLMRGNPPAVVNKDKYKYDFFEILDRMSGDEAAISFDDWAAARKEAGKPPHLEKLPGEL